MANLHVTILAGQPFNLTLDTAATALLLFAKGLTYQRQHYVCGNETGQRNYFDPRSVNYHFNLQLPNCIFSKSVSYYDGDELIPSGWDGAVPRYPKVPYVGVSTPSAHLKWRCMQMYFAKSCLFADLTELWRVTHQRPANRGGA